MIFTVSSKKSALIFNDKSGYLSFAVAIKSCCNHRNPLASSPPSNACQASPRRNRLMGGMGFITDILPTPNLWIESHLYFGGIPSPLTMESEGYYFTVRGWGIPPISTQFLWKFWNAWTKLLENNMCFLKNVRMLIYTKQMLTMVTCSFTFPQSCG